MRGLIAVGSVLLPLVACLDAYDSPPELESINLEKGLFDPEDRGLELRFSEPIDRTSLRVTLRLDRHNEENELCFADENQTLPDGCASDASLLVGPCRADPSLLVETEGGEIRFGCQGGSLSVAMDDRGLDLRSDKGLIPYERYVLSVAPGLKDNAGHERLPALTIPFQVSGSYPLAPTDFQSGMFFTVFQILKPVAAQFHFVFHVEVKPETGEIRIFGSDIDPNSGVDPEVSRVLTDFYLDPFPPTGTTILASGQVADPPDGRIFQIFPFTLSVTVPAILAEGAELTGRFGSAVIGGGPPSGPPGERQILEGTMYAPAVSLGLLEMQANLGEGRGTVLMYRLTPEESPPLADILPKGLTPDDVLNAFDDP